MDIGLMFTGKVQVNIRRLIPIESQKGFKWNIVSILFIAGAADGTVFFRQVKARADLTLCEKLAVFAVGAVIVRRLTSEMPAIVATNEEPTDPREPT